MWDFWLITAELDDNARGEVTQKDRPRGIAYEPELPSQPDTRIRVWVRTWSEIIEEAKRRLSYFQDGLNHDPSLEHALKYLVRQHADVIPTDLVNRVNAVEAQQSVGGLVIRGRKSALWTPLPPRSACRASRHRLRCGSAVSPSKASRGARGTLTRRPSRSTGVGQVPLRTSS